MRALSAATIGRKRTAKPLSNSTSKGAIRLSIGSPLASSSLTPHDSTASPEELHEMPTAEHERSPP